MCNVHVIDRDMADCCLSVDVSAKLGSEVLRCCSSKSGPALQFEIASMLHSSSCWMCACIVCHELPSSVLSTCLQAQLIDEYVNILSRVLSQRAIDSVPVGLNCGMHRSPYYNGYVKISKSQLPYCLHSYFAIVTAGNGML